MAKLKNKKTGVIKDIVKDFEASMYLATGEWEMIEEKQEDNSKKTPITEKEEK